MLKQTQSVEDWRSCEAVVGADMLVTAEMSSGLNDMPSAEKTRPEYATSCLFVLILMLLFETLYDGDDVIDQLSFRGGKDEDVIYGDNALGTNVVIEDASYGSMERTGGIFGSLYETFWAVLMEK
jgi:hypothetical protein